MSQGTHMCNISPFSFSSKEVVAVVMNAQTLHKVLVIRPSTHWAECWYNDLVKARGSCNIKRDFY